MHEWQSLSHVRGERKYHIVIVRKYRVSTVGLDEAKKAFRID